MVGVEAGGSRFQAVYLGGGDFREVAVTALYRSVAGGSKEGSEQHSGQRGTQES